MTHIAPSLWSPQATPATLKDASIEFQMVWNPADAHFTAIKNAFLNNSVIELGTRVQI